MNTSFWVKAKPTASALLRPRPTESDAPSTVRPALSASHVYSSLSKVWFHLGCLQMSTRNCPSNHSRDRHPISTAIRWQTMLPMMSAQEGRTTYTVDDAGCHKCTEADTKQPVNGHCPHCPDSQTGLLSSCQPCNSDSALKLTSHLDNTGRAKMTFNLVFCLPVFLSSTTALTSYRWLLPSITVLPHPLLLSCASLAGPQIPWQKWKLSSGSRTMSLITWIMPHPKKLK